MPYRFRILVVDDEPAQRELVAGFLNKQAFE
jgi:CheY-like chemotaxis protein